MFKVLTKYLKDNFHDSETGRQIFALIEGKSIIKKL